MDAPGTTYGGRALLPSEVALCNTVGLTAEEYLYFCQLSDVYDGTRDAEYQHIPDIRNIPVVPIVTTVIGLAISYGVQALSPKPKAPSAPTRVATPEKTSAAPIDTPDINGQTRFTSLYGFESLQSLAALGEIQPLVFTNYNATTKTGGIRVKALLLWSQLLSHGSGQALKALYTLGSGQLADKPDFDGYAIGDQLLKNYTRSRLALYFRTNGGRTTEADRYSQYTLTANGVNDPFLARDEQTGTDVSLFSGARTPGSQTVFGAYAPVNNGAPYWLPYELVLIFKNATNRIDLVKKREKIVQSYAPRQAMTHINGVPLGGPTTGEIGVGDTMYYTISSIDESEGEYFPHGLSDVNSGTRERRIFADDTLIVGDTYLFGSAVVQCTDVSTTDVWQVGQNKVWQFTCIEAGASYFQPTNTARYVGNLPYGFHLMRMEYAVVANNRKCDQTEIGIKSLVWKQINGFANVNSQPPAAVISFYEELDASITLGRVNKYIQRFSFFVLEIRLAGTNTWFDMSGGTVFAVRGTTQEPIFNFIRISHSYNQYEFRLRPIPGSVVFANYLNKFVNLLNGNGFTSYSVGGEHIGFSGTPFPLTPSALSNPEFIVGIPPVDIGAVTSFQASGTGTKPPGAFRWVQNDAPALEIVNPYNLSAVWSRADGKELKAYYKGINVTSQYSDPPANGSLYKPNLSASPIFHQAWFGWVLLENRSANFENCVRTRQGSTEIVVLWDGVDVSSSSGENKTYRTGSFAYEYQQTKAGEGYDAYGNPQLLVTAEYAANYTGVWINQVMYEYEVRAFYNGINVSHLFVADPESESSPFYYNGVPQEIIYGKSYLYTVDPNNGGPWNVYAIQAYRAKQGTPLYYYYNIQKWELQDTRPEVSYDWYIYPILKGAWQSEPSKVIASYENRAVVGGSGTGLSINAFSFGNNYWEFVVALPGSGYKNGESISHTLPDGTKILLIVNTADSNLAQSNINCNPYDALADYPKFSAERASHQDGPEHSIVYVNEQIRQTNIPQYTGLALAGLRMLSGREWTQLSQLTAYVKKGILVERLIDDNGQPTNSLIAPTNNIAEIIYNLLVNKDFGAGSKITAASVDRDRMQSAAQFCRANGFTWDGVLQSRVNLRSWIFEQAGYALMDFTILGGRFSLAPSVPLNSNFVIDSNQPPVISALFTDGNMRNMRVSWLSPDDRRLFKAVILYRKEVVNGFSETQTITIRLRDGEGGSDTDPDERFDLSNFCTSKYQAQLFGQYALLLRKYLDHSISFETTPQAAAGMQPGSYIKIVSEASHTSRFSNGSISGDGYVTTSNGLGDGSHNIIYWRPGDTNVSSASLVIASNKTDDSALFGCVFTVVNSEVNKRIYKVEEIAIGEDGLMQVTASHAPVTETGALAILGMDPTRFVIEEG